MGRQWRDALGATCSALSAGVGVWLGWIAAVSVGVWLVAALGLFIDANPSIDTIHETVAPIDLLLAVLVATSVSGLSFASAPRDERDPHPGALWATCHIATLGLSLVATALIIAEGGNGAWAWITSVTLTAAGLFSSTIFWAHDPRLIQRFNQKQEAQRESAEGKRAAQLGKQLDEADNE